MDTTMREKTNGKKKLVIFMICALAAVIAAGVICYAVGYGAKQDENLNQLMANSRLESDQAFQAQQEKLKNLEAQLKEKQGVLDQIATYQKEQDSLDQQLATKKGELSELKGNLDTVNASIASKKQELANLTAQVTKKQGAPIAFTAGKYICGTDFPAGKYDIQMVSGRGNLFARGSMHINEIFGSNSSYGHIREYKNAVFQTGDELELKSSLKVNLVPILAN